MRLLLLGPHPPYSGGSAYSCKELAAGLRTLGHTVLHLAPSGGKSMHQTYPALHWITCPFQSDEIVLPDDWVAAFDDGIRLVFKEDGPFDVVILGRESFLWNLPCVRSVHSGPVILLCRGAYLNRLKAGDASPDIYQRLYSLYRNCDLIIPIALHLVRPLRDLIGHPRVIFIPNPIDLPVSLGRLSVKQSGEPIELLMAAQLKPRKRPLDAVEIVERLVRSSLRVYLTVFGEGSLLSQFHQEIQMRNLSGHIKYRGTGERSEVLRTMEVSEIVLLCSEEEGLPRVLQEAMALQRGAVAYDNPGSREALTGWPLGRLVPIGRIDLATDAIQEVSDLMRDETMELPRSPQFRPAEVLKHYEATLQELALRL